MSKRYDIADLRQEFQQKRDFIDKVHSQAKALREQILRINDAEAGLRIQAKELEALANESEKYSQAKALREQILRLDDAEAGLRMQVEELEALANGLEQEHKKYSLRLEEIEEINVRIHSLEQEKKILRLTIIPAAITFTSLILTSIVKLLNGPAYAIYILLVLSLLSAICFALLQLRYRKYMAKSFPDIVG